MKKKLKIVSTELDKPAFTIKAYKEEFQEFEAHASRIKVQYNQLKALKSNLPKDHLIAQMGFAEKIR